MCISQCSCFTKVGRPVRRSSEQQMWGVRAPPTPLPFFLLPLPRPLPRTQDFQPLGIPSSPLLRARNPASGSEAWSGTRDIAYFWNSGRFHSPAAPILCSCCYPRAFPQLDSFLKPLVATSLKLPRAPVWPARFHSSSIRGTGAVC